MSPGVRCDRCGGPHELNYWVPDDVWEQIRPEPGPPGGGGAICLKCIDERCQEVGLSDVSVRVHHESQAVRILGTPEAPEDGDGEDATWDPDACELRQIAYEHREDGMTLTADLLDRCATRLRSHTREEPVGYVVVEHYPAWTESRGEVWPTKEEAVSYMSTLPAVHSRGERRVYALASVHPLTQGGDER